MIRGFILFFSICLFENAYSQDIVWARQSEDVALLEGATPTQLELDSDGNVYVLNILRGRVKFEGIEYQSQGSEDILLIKYNPQGNIVWAKQMGGSTWDIASDIAVDSHNNILITGVMGSGGTLLGATIDNTNGGAYFAKISADGNLVWVRQYGNPNAQGHAIYADQFDNVIVGGGVDSKNRVVAKYTPGGTLMWSQTLHYSDCCVSPSIVDIKTDGNNNIFIGGDFTGNIGFAGFALNAPTFYSGFIFKVNANGSPIWSNQIDSGVRSLNDARFTQMQIDPSGDVFVTGYFNDLARLDGIILKEQYDIDDRTGFITRMSSAGNFLWATAMYGRDMMPTSLRINPNTGELAVCGSSNTRFAYDNQYISSIQGNQSFILTTDKNGTFRSSMFINPESFATYSTDVVFTSANEFYAAGSFYDDFKLGCFDLQGGSWYTSYLFKSGKLPEITIDGLEAICVNEITTFEAQGAELATSFVWVFPEGTEAINGSFVTTAPQLDVKLTQYSARAVFTVIPYFECYPRTEFSGTVSMAREPDRPQKPTGQQIICPTVASEYSTVAMNGVIHYTWEVSDNITTVQPSASTISVTGAVPSTATLKVKAHNGCGASEFSEPMFVTIQAPPVQPVVAGPAEVCAGEKNVRYKASATNMVNYGWDLPSEVTVRSVSGDSAMIDVDFPSGIAVVTFRSLSKGLCTNSSSTSTTVTLIQAPQTPVIMGNEEVCDKGQAAVYTALPEQGSINFQWTVPQGFEILATTANTITVKPSGNAQPGKVTVKASNRCFASDVAMHNVMVMREPEKPVIKKGVCDRELAYDGQDEVVWFKNNELFTDQSNLLQLMAADSGVFVIVAENTCGIKHSEPIQVNPAYSESIFIPNVVTPNADGYNDTFVIAKLFENTKLQIYNRWGKVVHTAISYNNGWSGDNLSAGQYFYVLSNQCISEPLSGILHLIK
jgi:gliding motility-associated-like protein